jgi:cyclase
MTRAGILGSVVVAGVLTMAVRATVAQNQPDQPRVAEIEKVKDNLFVITGGGGNTAAFVTGTGVVVADTKLAGWGQRILDKIKSVTDKPITTIINTHTHGDHVGSNEFFDPSVDIVAQENTAANMARMPALQDASKKHALPDRTYKDRLSLFSGRDRIDLYYFGSGHTDGDTLVVFRDLRVMHSGDLFAQPATPFIDENNGGNGIAYPETLAKAAKGIANVDTIIPGHSAVTSWAAFVEYGEFNREFLTAVQASVNAGKTVDQAVADLKLPEKFRGYGMQAAKENVTKIYAELQK